jgi:hypothetical protein
MSDRIIFVEAWVSGDAHDATTAVTESTREKRPLLSNGHVLPFDNLSGLPPSLSDTLCRLTSGGALTRRLFNDQNEIVITAARPVILNGIEDIITRADIVSKGCRASSYATEAAS